MLPARTIIILNNLYNKLTILKILNEGMRLVSPT